MGIELLLGERVEDLVLPGGDKGLGFAMGDHARTSSSMLPSGFSP